MSDASLPVTPSYKDAAQELLRYIQMSPSGDDAARLIQLKMEMAHAAGAIQAIEFLRPSPPSSFASAIRNPD